MSNVVCFNCKLSIGEWIFLLYFFFFLIGCAKKTDHYQNAQKEFLDNDYIGAIIELNCAINNDGINDSALVLRAKCYSKILKHEKVISDLRRALIINKYNAEVRFELCKYYVSLSDTSRANKMLDTLISLKGKYVSDAWIEKGKINYFNDKFDNSISDFTNAIITDSSNYLAWYYRAIMRSTFYDKNGSALQSMFKYLDFEQAISDYRKAISIKHNFADAWYRMGLVYLNKFDGPNGIKAIDYAIVLEPKNSYYYIGRADYFYRLENYKRAINEYSKAIQISQNDPNSYEGRANCYKALGNIELFKEDFKKAFLLRKDTKTYKVM
jgi:tetratricopeptide (TPR) repeat protein